MTSPSHLTSKARRTRAALLNSAREIVAEKGPEKLSVMELCNRAGIGRPSFYTYFDSVETVLTILSQDAARRLRDSFAAVHQDTPRGLERLEDCILAVLKGLAENPTEGKLTVAKAETDPAIRDMIRAEILMELSEAPTMTLDHPTMTEAKLLADFLVETLLAQAKAALEGRLLEKQFGKIAKLMLAACH